MLSSNNSLDRSAIISPCAGATSVEACCSQGEAGDHPGSGGGDRAVQHAVVGRGYFFRLIRRPGSGELMETKLPWLSRVVRNFSLVRPVSWFFSSRTTDDVSMKPLVTEPMIRRFPSRTYFFSSDMFSPCLISTVDGYVLDSGKHTM